MKAFECCRAVSWGPVQIAVVVDGVKTTTTTRVMDSVSSFHDVHVSTQSIRLLIPDTNGPSFHSSWMHDTVETLARLLVGPHIDNEVRAVAILHFTQR